MEIWIEWVTVDDFLRWHPHRNEVGMQFREIIAREAFENSCGEIPEEYMDPNLAFEDFDFKVSLAEHDRDFKVEFWIDREEEEEPAPEPSLADMGLKKRKCKAMEEKLPF